MLSKNRIKYIHSFELSKNRKEEHAFIAEGFKTVNELLGKLPCKLLVAVPEWLKDNPRPDAQEVCEVSQEELQKASLLKTPQKVLAVFQQPSYMVDATLPQRQLCLALDDVQDPGNLGTIVRIADWFGIEHIFCSRNTVDVFNPKVVQATMGAIARVQVHYVDLEAFIKSAQPTAIYGTFLEGNFIYSEPLTPNGLIIMGNEGKGISHKIKQLVTHKLFIPNYPQGRETSESLNVAIATAITCAEFRRRLS